MADPSTPDSPAPLYRAAGVDIDAGDRAVELLKRRVGGTFGPEVLTGLGHFSGLYSLAPRLGLPPGGGEPVLVASADGVGTKLRLAILLDRHETVGQDLVNHCVNDILTCGARPLFFLDYLATGRVTPEKVAAIVGGMAVACRAACCALLGGETAEMPGFYGGDDYDLAGFVVGLVERGKMVLGDGIAPGDVVLGLPSNGLHTNGYSLARHVLSLDGDPDQARERLSEAPLALGMSVGDALLQVHRSYLPLVAPLLDAGLPVKGMAHITGGGLPGNISRILPAGTRIVLQAGSWPVPPIFSYLAEIGRINPSEMPHVFNMGLGYVLVLAPEDVPAARRLLPEALPVGEVLARGDEQPAVELAEGEL